MINDNEILKEERIPLRVFENVRRAILYRTEQLNYYPRVNKEFDEGYRKALKDVTSLVNDEYEKTLYNMIEFYLINGELLD